MLFIYPENPSHVDFIPRGQMGGFVKRFIDYVYIFNAWNWNDGESSWRHVYSKKKSNNLLML